MSDALIKIFGIAMLGALLGVAIKRQSPDIAVLFKLSVGIVISVACIVMLSPLVESVRELADSVSISRGAASCISVLIKAMCVAFLGQICATVCRDCGEGSIAGYVELGAKIEIIILCMPLITEVLGLALELASMSEG